MSTPWSIEVDKKVLVSLDCFIVIFGVQDENSLLFLKLLK
jgi:hypothetical protein